MGRKVHPKAFRIGVTQSWDGLWFANRKSYATLLQEDVKIREFLWKELKDALVDRVEVERSRQDVKLNIYAAKPGIIIGRGGAGIEELNKKLKKHFFRGRRVKVNVNVKEVKNPSLSARVIGLQMAADIEKRMPFRRVMKNAAERVMREQAKGVKIAVAGRLNGADIARTERVAKGSVPLHNLRSDINYANVMARTIYGAIGIKVWINRGEVFEKKDK